MRSLSIAAVLALGACAGSPRDFDPSTADARAEAGVESQLEGAVWEWVGTVTPVETIDVPQPERYTLRIEAGRAALRADCNRATGPVAVEPPGRMSFGALAATRAMCPPGSLSDRYLRDVARVRTYFFRDGALFLELPVDSGTLRFRRADGR